MWSASHTCHAHEHSTYGVNHTDCWGLLKSLLVPCTNVFERACHEPCVICNGISVTATYIEGLLPTGAQQAGASKAEGRGRAGHHLEGPAPG